MAQHLVLLISAAEIAATVQRLAQELDRDYGQRAPVMVGLLKGAFIFLADLIRHMHTPLQRVEFLQLSSYGDAMVSAGHATVTMGLSADAITHHRSCHHQGPVSSGEKIKASVSSFHATYGWF